MARRRRGYLPEAQPRAVLGACGGVDGDTRRGPGPRLGAGRYGSPHRPPRPQPTGRPGAGAQGIATGGYGVGRDLGGRPLTGAARIGWRQVRAAWGQGLAGEAAALFPGGPAVRAVTGAAGAAPDVSGVPGGQPLRAHRPLRNTRPEVR